MSSDQPTSTDSARIVESSTGRITSIQSDITCYGVLPLIAICCCIPAVILEARIAAKADLKDAATLLFAIFSIFVIATVYDALAIRNLKILVFGRSVAFVWNYTPSLAAYITILLGIIAVIIYSGVQYHHIVFFIAEDVESKLPHLPGMIITVIVLLSVSSLALCAYLGIFFSAIYKHRFSPSALDSGMFSEAGEKLGTPARILHTGGDSSDSRDVVEIEEGVPRRGLPTSASHHGGCSVPNKPSGLAKELSLEVHVNPQDQYHPLRLNPVNLSMISTMKQAKKEDTVAEKDEGSVS